MTFLQALLEDWRVRFGTERNPNRGETLFGTEYDPVPDADGRVVWLSFAEADGRRFVSCPEEFRLRMERFAERNPGKLFSEESLRQLLTLAAPFLERQSRIPDRFPLRWIVSCLTTNNGKNPPSAIHNGLRQLTREDLIALENRTTLRGLDPERSPVCGMVIGNRICCIAASHPSRGGNCSEIVVECEPSERGKGYGSVCTEALARILIRAGRVPLYEYYSSNSVSAKTAGRAGFTPSGMRYDLSVLPG